MIFRFLTIICALAVALPALAKVAEAPEGWTHDTRRSEAGIEVFKSPDERLTFVAGPTHIPTKMGLPDFLKHYVKAVVSKDVEILENHPSTASNTDPRPLAFHRVLLKAPDEEPEHIVFIAKRFEGSKPVQVYRLESYSPLTKDDAMLAMVMALATNLPIVENDVIQRVTERVRKEDEDAKLREEEEAAKPKPDPLRTEPGEGVPTEDLHGVAYDMGKMKYDVMSGIFKEVGVATWLMLKDGTAYRNPSIAPADLNVEKSREIEPGRWKNWRDSPKFKSLSFFEPLAKGTRVTLSVQRPQVSGWRGVVTTSTQFLNLYEDGRFDIASYSLTASDLTSDGSNTAVISKSDSKEGSSSSVSGRVDTGDGSVGTVAWQQKQGINPANMGGYEIDGLTIELRFDNGTVLRKLFAMRGPDNVILGRTNYWK